jgi:hypothetical protein
MTVYKSIATYLKGKETLLGCTYYPLQAPQNQSSPYCVFSVEDDRPEPTHDGGFQHGQVVVQFDFYATRLETIDNVVSAFKQHFVGQSLDLSATVTQAYAVTDNEFDGFTEPTNLYIRSIDLNIKYIKNN